MITKTGISAIRVCLIGFLTVLPYEVYSAQGEPAIVFEETLYDFGEAYEDEKITHTYVFKNNGSGALQILNTKTSCGCTAAIGTKDLIPPGGSSQIEVTYSLGKGKGEKSRTVTVSSNDPLNPEVKLTIKGSVRGVYSSVPPSNRLRFQKVPLGESRVQSLTIYPEKGTSFRINGTKFYKTDTNLKVDSVDTPRGDKKGKIIMVTLGGQQDVGRFSERFELYTDLDKAQTISITVLGDVVGPIQPNPTRVRVNFDESSQSEALATVKLKRQDGKSFSIIRALSEAPHISFNILTPKSGLQPAEIEIVVRREAQTQTGQSTIRVFTDDPQQSVISIPITWVVPRRSSS